MIWIHSGNLSHSLPFLLDLDPFVIVLDETEFHMGAHHACAVNHDAHKGISHLIDDEECPTFDPHRNRAHHIARVNMDCDEEDSLSCDTDIRVLWNRISTKRRCITLVRGTYSSWRWRCCWPSSSMSTIIRLGGFGPTRFGMYPLI